MGGGGGGGGANNQLAVWGTQAVRMGGLAANGILATAITSIVYSQAEALGIPPVLCTGIGAGVAAGGLYFVKDELVARVGQFYADLALIGAATVVQGITLFATTPVGLS